MKVVYLIATISAITGFLFGYDEGIISGTLHILIKNFQMGHLQTGVMTSALPFGTIFGSVWLSFILAGRYGFCRKNIKRYNASFFRRAYAASS